ncbi:MAG: hypothetical protein AAGA29_03600 [Planctomycetota bacterium]
MNGIQTSKLIPVILPGAAVDNAAFSSNVIDLNDFDGAGYIEFVGIIGDIDADMAQLRVMESGSKTDATTLGGAPAVVKAATTLPTAAADDNKVFTFGIDLRSPRERYLQLQATAGDGAAGTFLTAFAVGEPGLASSLAADRRLLFAEYA